MPNLSLDLRLEQAQRYVENGLAFLDHCIDDTADAAKFARSSFNKASAILQELSLDPRVAILDLSDEDNEEQLELFLNTTYEEEDIEDEREYGS